MPHGPRLASCPAIAAPSVTEMLRRLKVLGLVTGVGGLNDKSFIALAYKGLHHNDFVMAAKTDELNQP